MNTWELVDGNDSQKQVRYNLVIVAEGYAAADQAKFGTDITLFTDFLFSRPPFNNQTYRNRLNIYRLNVTSTDSGADDDDPSETCDNLPERASYFGARHCFDNIKRMIVVNDNLVMQEVNNELAEWHKILVFVNSHRAGGSGGSIAVVSTFNEELWEDTAVHELGHTMFGLGDEYGEMQTAGNPSETGYPNITLQGKNQTNPKWGSLIQVSTAVPTFSPCSHPGLLMPAGNPIGTFEGGNRYHCGFYRSQFNCLMRGYEEPRELCSVCEREVSRLLDLPVPG